MPESSDSKIDKLQKEFSKSTLHHALLFQGEQIQQIEEESTSLIRSILGMGEDQAMHPDLFHLRPTGKMRIISADATRGLIAELNSSSNQGGAKVAVIHEADRMRKESSNAFLKTLEEPPPDTYIILVTTRPYSILPTIRSRCLQVRLDTNGETLNNEEWADWLDMYEKWVLLLLDRHNLKNDRTSPVFGAYGLIDRMITINKNISDEEWKKCSKSLPDGVEDKEKDAIETSIRKGIRSNLIKSMVDRSRKLVVESDIPVEKTAHKLTKVVTLAEKITGLLEVNLKDETAFEYFWLSSLRTWSSKG
jgi:DNA polymerase-3 subunit delta'